MRRLLIGLPSTDGRAHLTLLGSLLAVQRRCFEFDTIAPDLPVICSNSSVTLARNRIAHEFLRSEADLLLTCDSDHSFELSDFEALLEGIETVGVCGCAYGRKSYDEARIRMAVFNMQGDLLKQGVGQTNFFPVSVGGAAVAGFGQIGGPQFLFARFGLGVTLITREAMQAAARKAPTSYRDELDGDRLANLYREGTISSRYDGTYTPEDFYFSDLCMEAGVRTAVFVNSKVVHWAGGWPFENNSLQIAKENGWI